MTALEALGARVWRLGGTGNPDLLVLTRGIYTPLEVKTGKGRTTGNQADIPWPIVRDTEQAISAVFWWMKMQNEIKSVASGRPKG